MKINYPIKYAAMPIVLEGECDVFCYIVSECYLLNEKTEYKEDGSSIKKYEVVFLYQPLNSNRWQKQVPVINFSTGGYSNSNTVFKTFDKVLEALKYVKKKNGLLFQKQNRTDYNDQFAKYKALEQEILNRSSMEDVIKRKDLMKVLKFENNKGKLLSINIYELLESYPEEEFIISHVSLEQYFDLFVSLIQENNPNININPSQYLAIHEKGDDFIKLAIEEGCGAYYLKNNEINYDINLEKVNIESLENKNNNLIFYTTETMDDLLYSYKKQPDILLEDIKTPTLTRKIKNKKD